MDVKQRAILKHGILIWMALQNSVHTIVLRYSRARSVPEMFLPSVAVFWMEIVKLVICLIIVCFEERSFKKLIFLLTKTFFANKTGRFAGTQDFIAR